MTPEQRARLEAWARTSTTGKNYFVPDDDSLFPALTAALAHIDALEARVWRETLLRVVGGVYWHGELEAWVYDLPDGQGCAYLRDVFARVKQLECEVAAYANDQTQAKYQREKARANALTAERDDLGRQLYAATERVQHLLDTIEVERTGRKEAAAERDALFGQATEWKRLYEGAKLRGDRWMADAKQAEPIAAAISAFVQEEGDISVRWVFAPGVSVFSECGDAHKKWHGLVQQVVFLVDGLLRRQQEAEREREEARALVRHLQSELRAEVDGCKEAERTAAERDAAVTTWEAAARSWELRAEQAEREREEAQKRLACMESHYAQLERANEQAERTAAALREALCRHGIHDVTCAKRRSLFTLYEAVPCDCGFDAALAPTKEEA